MSESRADPLTRLDLLPLDPGRRLICGAPEGQDARIVALLARRAGSIGHLHVCADDARAARLQEMLSFFDPDLQVISLPAWDCLPYDRVSPNPSVVSRRIDAISAMLVPKKTAPWVVITTVNALTQRLPPRSAMGSVFLRCFAGDQISMDTLQNFLARNGYTRAQTVREAGEFALRGGIVDFFPPGADEPVRLDMFGDEIERIRAFDPMTQMTTAERDGLILRPMAELFLDEPSITRFRSGYRERFGTVLNDDPLYEAVTAGRRHAGVEHWLPLFHERLDSLFDYLPDCAVTLEDQAEAAARSRFTQIADFYQARRTLHAAGRKANAPVYKPLPPELLYLGEGELSDRLADRRVGVFSPFGLTAEAATMALDAGARRGREFSDARANVDVNVFDAVRTHAGELRNGRRRVLVAATGTGARERLKSLLLAHGLHDLQICDQWKDALKLKPTITGMIVLGIEHGFVSDDLAIITEEDILGDRLIRPARKKRQNANFIAEVSALNTGDIVVHIDHGIGKYDGLETITVNNSPHDCLKILYDAGDKLFIPVENLELLSRYGSEDSVVQLDRLGGVAWQARRSKIRKRLRDMANALISIAAERELRTAPEVTPPDGVFDEFCARFPYPETEDQQNAIDDVLGDLSSGRPMDRLVCGDVGFGKTEVALRAAFCAVMGGMQVAVVVPTTLLARQHFRTFSARFKGMPVQIGQLSRLVTGKDSTKTKDSLRDGTLDIVIGTHSILSKSVSFNRLGLVIVDEEQHFGVKQKEQLKSLRSDVHVLTLTATPIPRTLQLALAGVRELSMIATPPIDRLAVRTFVLPYDPMVIREALMREHFRGGQSFVVCPRIEGLDSEAQRLKELVPELRLVTAHGQMTPTSLDDVMSSFDGGKFDILLSTNIVESGLDIPSANTMIIIRADLFGLSQLYQLRGRIGRSKLRGYAYLTYASQHPLTTTARQRLEVIETLDSLGAGFQLASHDMDIRGAGNLLGEEQSGHIREVGIELYQQMLEEAVAAARVGMQGEAEVAHWSPQINLGMPVLIPETYVQDLNVRLGLYRRLAQLVDAAEIEALAAEMIDRFGSLPLEVENLVEVMMIKQLCRNAQVERLDAGPKGAVLSFRPNAFPRPGKILDYVSRRAGVLRLRPDSKLVIVDGWDDHRQRVRGVSALLRDLAGIVAA